MLPQQRGSIIHFASMYGLVSPDPSIYAPKWNVNPIDYGAAKAAVLQMTRYQAVMWGKSNVRVNAVVPGPFPNPIGMGADTDFLAKLAAKTALQRVGKAEEIAGAVAFLAADASSYVTGAQIVVDGGWTAW
jgi:NAD(P)-dependent dehydrogenase (short-subunit alcohol dehydrogenase family)